MKKIISFTVWGDNPIYTIGALKNADLAKDIYPDWICRYYLGSSTPKDIINSLEGKDNVEVVLMKESGDYLSTLWRFLPASEDDVEIMICRDSDSRLSAREKAAVDEWISSDKGFHIMRDHPAHGTAILAGMWGAKQGSISEMRQLIDEYKKDNFRELDQQFLREKIYPLVKNNSFVHDEFFEKKPFPISRREGLDHYGNPKYFIGEPVDENDNRIW